MPPENTQIHAAEELTTFGQFQVVGAAIVRPSVQTPASLLPGPACLKTRLSAALLKNGRLPSPLTVIRRQAPRMMCTYPNEIVTCRDSRGMDRRIFVKYESSKGHRSHGHRGNVRYEAEVYQRVLQYYPGFRPRYFGANIDPKTGETWLVLEYLDRSIRLHDMFIRRGVRQPAAMAQAARWIGQFHAAHPVAPGTDSVPFLIRYDADYFRGWASRTLEFAAPLRDRFPWLEKLWRHSAQWAAILLESPQVIIHGEFYPENVLVRRQKIHALDWESAAVGPGEIDLVALTEGGWPASYERRSLGAYRHARWPHGIPAHFEQCLEAARMYLQFRWLGERKDWAIAEENRWRYEQLHLSAKKLGML